MRDIQRIMLSSEIRDLTDEIGRLFEDLDRTAGDRRQPSGHCTPALDVRETDQALEVILDLPGVAADRLRVLLKGGVLLVVGEKCSPYAGGHPDASFHLVERGFGRFARAVRLEGAFDGGQARAQVSGGELRVTVPRIADRRGQEILVPVAAS